MQYDGSDDEYYLGQKPAYQSRFLSPHSHIPSRMGISDLPLSVKLYSTLGGIWGYSSLCYAKLIVMQSQFRIPFKTQESGTFYFA